jgi:hypothetical protein
MSTPAPARPSAVAQTAKKRAALHITASTKATPMHSFKRKNALTLFTDLNLDDARNLYVSFFYIINNERILALNPQTSMFSHGPVVAPQPARIHTLPAPPGGK